jgi:lysophospholipase
MKLVLTPDNPAPPDGIVSSVRAADGVEIRVVRWHPQGAPRGAVVLAGGRAEFIEKYFETAGELLARGFAVVAFDWRGQGLSGRELPNRRKGHIDDFLIYERDLGAVVEQALEPFCPRPWFALAHSMGASVLIQQARGGRSPFERVALTAPMIEICGVHLPRGARFLAETLNVLGLGAAYIPFGKGQLPSVFDGNRLTGDWARFMRNANVAAAEPDLCIGDPTIGWVDAAFRLIDEMADPEYPRRTLTPILIFAAGADRVVSTPHIERFGNRLKAGRVVMLDHSEHEILQERDFIREQFWAGFDAFIPGSADEADMLARKAAAAHERR